MLSLSWFEFSAKGRAWPRAKGMGYFEEGAFGDVAMALCNVRVSQKRKAT